MAEAGDDDHGYIDGSEELLRLREIFAQSPSFSALLHGPEHRFVLTNPAYQQLIGHRDVIGLTVREAVPELEAGLLSLLDEAFATGKPFIGKNVKIVLQRTPGSAPGNPLFGFRLSADQGRGGQGDLDFCRGSDVTDRHRTEEALRASKANLCELNRDLERQVIERAQARGLTWKLSPDLLGALNSKGYFETANPAWENVLGWSEEEVVSMSIFELLHPDDLEHTRAGFELTQVGQPALRFVNRYRCKDGSYRWISWVGIPEEGYVYCTGRDITAEREAEIELAAAQEALRQSQKMEAIGQLTGGIAHDFNNLLTGIIGSLDIIRRRMASGRLDAIPRFMDAASTSAQRAAALTHRLLAFARRQSLDIRPNDINRLVASMEDLLHRTLGEHIELRMLALRRPLDRLHRCQSARERSSKSRDQCARRDARWRPSDYRNNECSSRCSLYLRSRRCCARRLCGDQGFGHGYGHAADVVAKAVDPFFTTKPVGEGTGLGLSMIYGFAKQTRGHLRIYSEVGHGTTVKLYLPRALQDAVGFGKTLEQCEPVAREKRSLSWKTTQRCG